MCSVDHGQVMVWNNKSSWFKSDHSLHEALCVVVIFVLDLLEERGWTIELGMEQLASTFNMEFYLCFGVTEKSLRITAPKLEPTCQI